MSRRRGLCSMEDENYIVSPVADRDDPWRRRPSARRGLWLRVDFGRRRRHRSGTLPGAFGRFPVCRTTADRRSRRLSVVPPGEPRASARRRHP